MAPLVVIAGTGTGVGKTHVAAALLRAWGASSRVVGYKPVETGTGGGTGEDAQRLLEASTFHVKHSVFRQTFPDPVSPHLAARRLGATIELAPLVQQTRALRAEADGVILELAGGLCTPLAPGTLNAHLALKVDATRIVVVAPDRLGVLHDVGATLHAAKHLGLGVSGVVLSEVAHPDASSGTNAREIGHVFGTPVLGTFPWETRPGEATRKVALSLLTGLQLG
jgi:dethiobiotin synthetase